MKSIIGELARDYFEDYEGNETVTIADVEDNESIDARITGLSDGSWYFSDSQRTVRISRRINIGYIKYDECRGYVYRNGKTVRELA